MLLVVKDDKIIGFHADSQNIDRKMLSFYEDGSKLVWVPDNFKYDTPIVDVIDKQHGLPIPPITTERYHIMIGDPVPVIADPDFIKTNYQELRNISYEYFGEQLDAIIKGFKVLKSQNINIGKDMEDLIAKVDFVKSTYPK
jgi:hypothetical protein